MGEKRVGGFIFRSYTGDHQPLHVHVCDQNGRELGRWNLEDQTPMDGLVVTRKLARALRTAGYLMEERV
jgi:hypothetical protein